MNKEQKEVEEIIIGRGRAKIKETIRTAHPVVTETIINGILIGKYISTLCPGNLVILPKAEKNKGAVTSMAAAAFHGPRLITIDFKPSLIKTLPFAKAVFLYIDSYVYTHGYTPDIDAAYSSLKKNQEESFKNVFSAIKMNDLKIEKARAEALVNSENNKWSLKKGYSYSLSNNSQTFLHLGWAFERTEGGRILINQILLYNKELIAINISKEYSSFLKRMPKVVAV